ncbi:putative reverse transcriptase domain-containing protein [Tanacetum coccineum]
MAEPDVQVPLDEIEIDENLCFVEEPVEIVERDMKKLKRRRIPLVKVRWNSRQGAECCNLSLEDKALLTGGDCNISVFSGSSGRKTPRNAGGTMNVHGCSHKTFMNGKPHTFNGTEGVVGLRRWIEKLRKWLVNANHIPWTEFKTMMTTEYCPATEIQRMKQELWTLTLKGDDIEAYNNRFHELALMCPELVPTDKKKIKRYTRGFPERIKGNITSSKHATLHDAINMAHELVEQTVQSKATRIGESNKRKWEDHQRNNNRNRNNNYHQQRNRRQETARAYAVAPTENRGYARNLPKSNRYNFHHSRQCPPKCQKCQRTGHLEKDCRAILPGNQHNKGSRTRAYVVVENPQQNPNVVTAMDWLSHHQAVIDCYEKIIRIPLPNDEFLEVQGERPKRDPGSLACIKADEKEA